MDQIFGQEQKRKYLLRIHKNLGRQAFDNRLVSTTAGIDESITARAITMVVGGRSWRS